MMMKKRNLSIIDDLIAENNDTITLFLSNQTESVIFNLKKRFQKNYGNIDELMDKFRIPIHYFKDYA